MKLTHAEFWRLDVPLVTPFVTVTGTTTVRDVLLVRVLGPETEGWGECVAMGEPHYSSEHVAGAHEVTRRFLLPLLATDLQATDVASSLAPVKGHRMAKAAIEAAVLDAQSRLQGRSLAASLGATSSRVPAGVSIGLVEPVEALCEQVAQFIEAGYMRVKVKIAPGYDLAPLTAIRERFGDVLLQADANGSYDRSDIDHLRALDDLALVLLEQPFDDDDLIAHADLARRCTTPVCLDEAITSVDTAATALELGACSVVNLKPGRVGGLLEAVRIRDLCVARGAGLWCGGMLETGIGRAGNVALAALAGFTLPGDLSASDRYVTEDVTEPFVLQNGHLTVPTGVGLGVAVRPDVMARLATARETVRLG